MTEKAESATGAEAEESAAEPQTGPAASQDDTRFEVKWRKKAAAPSPAPTVTAPEGDAEGLRRELAEAQERIRDLQDRWQRAAADLVNLRRRTEQERGEHEKFANMVLIAQLLPVLDNFERALVTIPGNLAMLTWIQGVMLIERQFRALLEHEGLAVIEAEGNAFTPTLHEAIAEVERTDLEPGTVARVYQPGYTMHGRVVRPALVEIAKRPQAAPQTSAADDAVTTDAAATDTIAGEAETENTGP